MKKKYSLTLQVLFALFALNLSNAQYKPDMVTVKGGTFMMGPKKTHISKPMNN